MRDVAAVLVSTSIVAEMITATSTNVAATAVLFTAEIVAKLIAIANSAVAGNTVVFPGIISNFALHADISSLLTKIR